MKKVILILILILAGCAPDYICYDSKGVHSGWRILGVSEYLPINNRHLSPDKVQRICDIIREPKKK